MLWPKYCITKVNKDVMKVKYYQSIVTKVNKDVLYYKSKQRCMYCITKVQPMKVLYYKSKQRCYDQSIVLQK